ncbi:MAG: UbiA family prenyltransferase [Planctomycetota bacterium]|nr:UbiA family prenyltransferase [Planctomycetota bacterium]
MRTRAFLELIRVFLTPSALADSLAGYALASAVLERPYDPLSLGAALLASIFLYWFGMATNDVFDRERDRVKAPGKPLPGGRISLRAALVVSATLVALALGAAAAAGTTLAALAVLALALGYNGGGKRLPVLGNLLMGSARAGNFLLGAGAVAPLGEVLEDPSIVAGAALLGLYVAGVTAVSVLEDRPYRPRVFHVLASPLLGIPLLLAALEPLSARGWLNSVALIWLLIRTQRRAASRRAADHPAAVYVRSALAGIFLVDAGIIWTFTPPGAALYPVPLAIYCLALLGWWWKRGWLQSGRPDT